MNELQKLLTMSNELATQLVASGGEITPEMERALTVIDIRTAAAVDASAFLMTRMENEATYWEEMAAKYQAIAKGCRNAKERINDSIKAGMRQLEINELEGRDVRFRLVGVKARLIVNEEHLDQDYLETKTLRVPNKDRIRADLESGLEVEGAFLQPSFGLKTYPNTKGDRK